MFVDKIEHVGQALVILLSGKEVDCQLTRMKQRQMQLTRATEKHTIIGSTLKECFRVEIHVL